MTLTLRDSQDSDLEERVIMSAAERQDEVLMLRGAPGSEGLPQLEPDPTGNSSGKVRLLRWCSTKGLRYPFKYHHCSRHGESLRMVVKARSR